jgi:alkylation response protein AidB-like acyl-CoA dehydrogenase
MDFSLSQEQVELQKLARQILADQTHNEHLREIDTQEDRFDEKLWRDLGDSGLLGIGIAEAQGGMDLGFESVCLLVEEVGATVAPVPVIPTLVSAALPIQCFGSEEQRQRLLPGVAAGELLLSAALAESGNEDPCAPLATARERGSGWSLSGEKICVPFASRSERILLAARVDGGLAVFLLDPNAEGVELKRQVSTAGEPQFQILLSDARVACEDFLVGPDTAPELLRWTAERSAAAYCAMALGVADRSTRMTAEYTAEREQFGVKIATFQAVGQRAADCYIDVQCLRGVTQQAISLLNGGREAADEVAIAKIWAGDVLHRVSHAAQHLHGGIGVDRDYPLFRYCLWAKQIELTMGSSAELTAQLGERIAAEFSA